MAIVSVQITALSETGVILKEHMRYKKDSGIHSSFAYVMQTIERWKGDKNVAKIIEITRYDVCSSTEIDDGMHEIELWVRYRKDEIVKLEPVDSPLPGMFRKTTKVGHIDWKKPLRNKKTKEELKLLHIRNTPGYACVILLDTREHIIFCNIHGEFNNVDGQEIENIPEYEEKEVQFWANIFKDDDNRCYGSLHPTEEIAKKYNGFDDRMIAIPVTLKLKFPINY